MFFSPQMIARVIRSPALDGGGGLSPTTWNPSDVGGSVALSGGNLIFSTTAGGNSGVRSTNPLSTGKVYFEVTIGNQGSAAFNCGCVNGSGSPDADTANPAGAGAVIVFANGGISPSGSIGAGFSNGDICCVAVDVGSKLAWFRKNAGNWNGSGTNNPATGVGGVSFSSVTGPFYAFGGFSGGSASMTANFGATSFTYTVPSGFTAGWSV
jgi:hypothetical protein